MTCGEGKQTKRRTCSNPAPAYGGNACTGDNAQTMECMKDSCKGKAFLIIERLLTTTIFELKQIL